MLTREGCRDWRWDSAGWVYLYTYTFTSTWVVGLLTSEELRFVYVERGGKSKFTDPGDEITSLRASQTVYSLKWHPRWSTRRKDDECVPLEKLSKGNEKEVEESSATTNVDSDSCGRRERKGCRVKRMKLNWTHMWDGIVLNNHQKQDTKRRGMLMTKYPPLVFSFFVVIGSTISQNPSSSSFGSTLGLICAISPGTV